jgi:hypothetical protein
VCHRAGHVCVSSGDWANPLLIAVPSAEEQRSLRTVRAALAGRAAWFQETALILSGFTAAAFALSSVSFSQLAPEVPPGATQQNPPQTIALAAAVPVHSFPTGEPALPADGSVESQKGIAAQSEQKPAPRSLFALPFRIGMDYYNGISSVPGRSRFSDGLWAGSSLAAPSVGYARWEDARGNAMRVSLGIGGMYTGGGRTLNQPVEAYWQKTTGQASVTVGKYWLRFGSQEWEYESRPGVMLQWSGGPHTLAISTNYNTTTHRMNAYARGGRAFGQTASLGVSVGGGKGLTYDTLHDAMWGLDGMAAYHGWRLTGEYVGALRGSQGFQFTTAKLAYERLGVWRPYVGIYSWDDHSGALGAFSSTVYGLQYQLTGATALDLALAPTSAKRTYWLQIHTAWER